MAVLNRNDLEQSPLADLHALAADLGVEGFRRMRREQLIDQLATGDDGAKPIRKRDAKPRGERPAKQTAEGQDEELRSGPIEVLGNGSAFIRAREGGKSEDDVYISPAQVRRCELSTGDVVSGPVRKPRRSERYPALIRVVTINGDPADERAARPRLDKLTASFPSSRLRAPAGLEAAPFGRGSRVVVSGPPGAGATTLLRSIARTLTSEHQDLSLTIALLGVRPEEVGEWRAELPDAEIVGGSFDQPIEAQSQAASAAVDRASRAAEQGADAAIVADSLDALGDSAARKLLAAGRNTEEAGSVTIVATWSAPHALRLATTRIVLSGEGGGQLDAVGSGTLKAELLA